MLGIHFDASKFYIFHNMFDISKYYKFHNLLKENFVKLLLSHSAAGIGNWSWDLKSNTVEWDEKMYHLYGLVDSNNIEKKQQVGIDFSLFDNKNILIVDDDEINKMIVELFLKDISANLFFCNNGLEALKLIKTKKRFDLILMDMQMPVLNGYDATKEIRAIEGENYHKIIATTASALDKDIKLALSCGCDDVLSKPMRQEVLVRKIYENLLQINAKNVC